MNTNDLQGIAAVTFLATFIAAVDWLLQTLGYAGSIATAYYSELMVFTENIYGAWTKPLFLSFFVGLVCTWSMLKNWRQGLAKVAILVALVITTTAAIRFSYAMDVRVASLTQFTSLIMATAIVPMVGIAGTIYGTGALIRFVYRAVTLTMQAVAAIASSCMGNIYNALKWSVDAGSWARGFFKPADDRAQEQNSGKAFWEEWFADQARQNAQDQQQQKAREKSSKRQTHDDFDPSRFGAKASAMPYGVDKRHKDDVALWAVVDDPNANPNERQNAFASLLKKQTKRLGKSGGNVAAA